MPQGSKSIVSIRLQKPFCAINESDVFSEATLRSDHPIVYKYHEKQKERKQKRNKLNQRKKNPSTLLSGMPEERSLYF